MPTDEKITQIQETSDLADADLFVVVQNVSTAPITRGKTGPKIKAWLKAYFDPIYALDGWASGTGTWSYSNADSPSFVASVPDADAALINVGNRIKITQTTIKYFIVTAKGSPSGGYTPVTLYGGTDYTLANAAITSPYYSHAESPVGFPKSPLKWSVIVSDNTLRSQTPPTQNIWYNLGGVSITIPIGAWKVDYQVAAYANDSTASVAVYTTLSSANNTESDIDLTGYSAFTGISATVHGVVTRMKDFVLAAKATYYLNTRTTTTTTSTIGNNNAASHAVLRAVSAYL